MPARCYALPQQLFAQAMCGSSGTYAVARLVPRRRVLSSHDHRDQREFWPTRMVHRGARVAWSKPVTSEQPCACGTSREPALARACGGNRYEVIPVGQGDG